MPILDPFIQNFLLNEKIGKNNSENAYRFYCRYLKIASLNIYKNYTTIEVANEFKQHLRTCIQLIAELFECQLNENDFLNPTINNYYKYLYEHITKATYQNKKTEKLSGIFFKLSNKYETFFFQPNVLLSNYHSWFFTDTPIAILNLNVEKNIDTFFSFIPIRNQKLDITTQNKIYQLIMLEIYLMKAAGLTLVLCIKYFDYKIFSDLVNCGQFSEIHLTIDSDENMEDFLKNAKQLKSNNSFIYIYSPFVHKYNIYKETYKSIKQKPRIHILTFSNNINKSIIKPIFQETHSFVYCKTGFKYKYLRISLSNVPIYDQKDDNESFVPVEISGLAQCYISPDDFLIWKNERVKIIFDDGENKPRSNKYINFEDMHIIRKDFYVKDPLSVGKIKIENLDTINELEKNIQNTISKRKNQKYKKQLINSISKEKGIQN